MAVSKKSKVSKTKQKNFKKSGIVKKNAVKTKKSGTPKSKKFPKKIKNDILPKTEKNLEEQSAESDDGEDLLDMVDKDDLDFLDNAFAKGSYNLLNDVNYRPPKCKKRKVEDNGEILEMEYEEQRQEPSVNREYRNVLPIKTKDGFIPQQVFEEAVSEDEELENKTEEGEEMLEDEGSFEESENKEQDISQPISAAKLLSRRTKLLSQKRLEIGVLSAQVLETPDEKISNLSLLLKCMDEKTPEIYLTIRKLAIASLLEVFKDIVPSYKIRNHKDENVLLKKTTLKLRKFETELLQHYKSYLRKLEKFCMVLQKKKGKSNKIWKEAEVLGKLALHSMCDLFVNQPYFNFAENIAQVVIPFLNHPNASIRTIVKSAIAAIFETDKKKEITLRILRIIYHYLKKHARYSGLEILEVLLVLRLTPGNLEKSKELDMKQKKLMSKKQNVLQISKKERKRSKQLKRLENELLETKAEENQQAKEKNVTEATKIVFSIFFMILKNPTNNKAVGICLEGLAKYAHCINLEYYIDIVNLIDELLKNESLLLPQKLNCIKTVFTILNGQGESLDIDPTRFYNNLFKNLMHISANSDIQDLQKNIIKILADSLIKRKKKINNKRMIGFMKRLSILSLQLLHPGTLGLLVIITNIMRSNKTVDILLDADSKDCHGIYMPEFEDPEYTNASSTALYELSLLHKHYHPIVRKFADYIAHGVPITGEGCLAPELSKLMPEEIFQNFDMTDLTFNPSVPVPKKIQSKARRKDDHFLNSSFEQYCKGYARSQLTKGKVCI
ncbi:hypothetical protein WA026_004932 [Henosepilachna vigintioctopunctata]|uniref:NOC3-like protein n=1 Tax=Henosepilachna vigintioctopunctata TaxID=420089 RepID=A0AAW1UVI9_9CUCU